MPRARVRAITRLALTLSALLATAPAGASAGDPLRASQWNLDMIGAEAAHRVSTGGGALIAVVDSGVRASHPDLAGRVEDGPDFVGADEVPDDESGHGTTIASIIAAHKGNGIGIEGAAPDARILAIRVLGADNRGTLEHEAAGIDAAVDAGAQIINLSTGPDLATPDVGDAALIAAIERAVSADAVVVAAAGNYGAPLCNQPLVGVRILCVGAVNRLGTRSGYSNFGARTTIAAPGDDILSAGMGGGYVASRGTSQAASQVAAAAALLVSLGLRGSAIIDRLEQTATPLAERDELGHGLLNMSAAVAGLGGTPASRAAPSPRAMLDAYTPSRVRYLTARRHGLAVVCTSSRPGSCHVRVTCHGRLLASGSHRLAARIPATVRARLTPIGRRALTGTRRVDARITVTQWGTDAVWLRTSLRR